MGRFAAWLSRNAEVAIALALSIALALLTLADVLPAAQNQNIITAATLVVLALLTTVLLRDCIRAGRASPRSRSPWLRAGGMPVRPRRSLPAWDRV